jgi:hypothetical protein
MKRIIFLPIIFFLLLIAYSGKSNDSRLTTTETYTPFIPTDSSQFYFPLEVFTDTSRYIGPDTLLNTWYSQHLFAMREPIIFIDKSQNVIYRFTWLRTFHNPIAIRIEKHRDSYILYWKLCDGAGGYEPGKLKIDEQKTIDKQTWDIFMSKIDNCDFWNLETNERELLGRDGSQWILEGKDEKRYHVVDRWTPEGGTYYQCCDFLIQLTNIKINDRDKY